MLKHSFFVCGHTKGMKTMSILCAGAMFFSPIKQCVAGNVVSKNVTTEVCVIAKQNEYDDNIKITATTNQKTITITPTANGGYDPQVKLFNFLNNGLSQIYYTVNSAGSGGYIYSQIISLEQGRQTTIFDSLQFQTNARLTWQDNKIRIVYAGQTLYLDASQNDLTGEKSIYLSPVNVTYPIYTSYNNGYQLLLLQKVYVDYAANNVGYLTTLLDFNATQPIASVGVLTNFNPN